MLPTDVEIRPTLAKLSDMNGPLMNLDQYVSLINSTKLCSTIPIEYDMVRQAPGSRQARPVWIPATPVRPSCVPARGGPWRGCSPTVPSAPSGCPTTASHTCSRCWTPARRYPMSTRSVMAVEMGLQGNYVTHSVQWYIGFTAVVSHKVAHVAWQDRRRWRYVCGEQSIGLGILRKASLIYIAIIICRKQAMMSKKIFEST